MSDFVTIHVPSLKVKYTFTGVVSLQHSMTLTTDTSEDASSGSDTLNGARNQPDTLTISVVESEVYGKDRPSRILQALEAVKRKRLLCDISTTMRNYRSMLLSEMVVTQDASNPFGWSGNLTFTEASSSSGSGSFGSAGSGAAGGGKKNDNSSTPKNTGYGSAKKVQGSGGDNTPLGKVLTRAAVKLY